MLKNIYRTTKTVSPEGLGYNIFSRHIVFQNDSNSFLAKIRYYPDVSLSSLYYSTNSRVFRDGTKCGVGGYWNATNPDDFIVDRGRLIFAYKSHHLYNMDAFTGLLYGDPFCATPYDYNNKFSAHGSMDYSNGVTYFALANSFKVMDFSTGLIVDTIPATGAYNGLLFWSRDSNILMVRWSDYAVLKYTVAGGAPIFSSFIPSDTKQVAYDYVNDVLMCWRSDNKFYYYIFEEEAATLSAITRTPSAVNQYSGTQLSVTLTGSSGLPVANAWVKWTIDPTTPFGTLSAQYSKTNSSGVAVVTYIPPRRTGDEVTVTAEVSV